MAVSPAQNYFRRPPQAYGESVCSVLNFLTDKALSAAGHLWQRPVYAGEDATEVCDHGELVFNSPAATTSTLYLVY